jgi:hypothetical protein
VQRQQRTGERIDEDYMGGPERRFGGKALGRRAGIRGDRFEYGSVLADSVHGLLS